MKLELTIWKNQKEVDTVYTVESYDIMWGTVTDLATILDLDTLIPTLEDKDTSNMKMASIVGNVITGSMDLVNDTLLDVFEGVTKDELRRVKLPNLIQVVIGLVKGSTQSLGKIIKTNNEKN